MKYKYKVRGDPVPRPPKAPKHGPPGISSGYEDYDSPYYQLGTEPFDLEKGIGLRHPASFLDSPANPDYYDDYDEIEQELAREFEDMYDEEDFY